MSRSRSSTWTQWMLSHPVARSKTPSCNRYCTGEPRRPLRRIGAEHLLIIDPARAEAREGPQGRARTSRVRDAGNARRPAVPHALLGRVIELLGRGRVFQGPERSDPAGELGVRVTAGEMGELEVGVRVDEARDEDGVGELDPAGPGGEGYIRVRPDRGDPAIVRNENGAVRDGRRRDRMDRARTNAEHLGTHGDTPVPNGACTGQACDGSVPG